LHDTFVREAREAGTAGRPRCRTLFLGDSITEAMRGSQFGEMYDELAARRDAFETWFPLREARAFGVSGDRTQHLLWRVRNGELAFRHPPGVVVVNVGTNNLGRDNDSAADTFLGIRAVVLEILQRLPGTRVLLTGVLPRGPGLAERDAEMDVGGANLQNQKTRFPLIPPAPGESAGYAAPGGSESSEKDLGSKYAQPGVHSRAIDDVNAKLEALANGSGGSVGYVNCADVFLRKEVRTGKATIDPTLMRDALHPTAEGLRAWFAVLKPAVEALREAPAPLESWYAGSRAFGDDDDGQSLRNGSLRSVEPGMRLALSRLIAWSPYALCVCDCSEPDSPIVFANDNFFTQTGYGPEDALGKNCRFLQGKDTDAETVFEMREKIARGEEFSGKILNYHKNGVPLINSLVVSPLRDSKGRVSHYIGIQRLATAQALRDAPAEYQHRAAL
jgi:PAS domain S-box-containing protein